MVPIGSKIASPSTVITLKINIPIVVRLQGTNVELGTKILEESRMKIISASDLTDAAIKVVASVKGKAK